MSRPQASRQDAAPLKCEEPDKHVGTFVRRIPTNIKGNAPSWKSATAVLTALYPTVVLFTYTVRELLTAANNTLL